MEGYQRKLSKSTKALALSEAELAAVRVELSDTRRELQVSDGAGPRVHKLVADVAALKQQLADAPPRPDMIAALKQFEREVALKQELLEAADVKAARCMVSSNCRLRLGDPSG